MSKSQKMYPYDGTPGEDAEEIAITAEETLQGEEIALEIMSEEELEEHQRVRQSMRPTSRNNPTHKRTPFEREMDYVDIARLYLRGWPTAQIVEWIGHNRPYTLHLETVQGALRELRRRWREEYVELIDEAKAIELQRLDRIEQEAWDAWENSKKKRNEIERFKTSDKWSGKGNANKPTYTRERIKHVIIERDPNAKYLEVIMWCIDKRVEILGLNAPKRVDINWRKEAEAAGVNPEEVISELERQFLDAATKQQQLPGGSSEGSLGTNSEETGHPDPDGEVQDLPG